MPSKVTTERSFTAAYQSPIWGLMPGKSICNRSNHVYCPLHSWLITSEDLVINLTVSHLWEVWVEFLQDGWHLHWYFHLWISLTKEPVKIIKVQIKSISATCDIPTTLGLNVLHNLQLCVSIQTECVAINTLTDFLDCSLLYLWGM